MTLPDRHVTAALASLIILQGIMLSALYAGIAPHPPAQVAPFAMAPFLAAAMAAAISAIILGPLESTAGKALSVIAAVAALVSFGPQKYLDAQFALIWPAVLTGQFAALVIFAKVAGSATAKARA